MSSAGATHLLNGHLVVDGVDNANDVCLSERSADTWLGLQLECHCEQNSPTYLRNFLKQLLICLLCFYRKKHKCVDRTPGRRRNKGTPQSCLTTWIIYNVSGNPFWCDIRRYRDLLDSIRNLQNTRLRWNSQSWRCKISAERIRGDPYHIWELLTDQGHDKRRFSHLGCETRAAQFS